MLRASMKVLFGSWFLEYCGKVCFGLFGGIFYVFKNNFDWICLLFRRRPSRIWSVPLRWWKTSTVTSLKRSLWTMTSRLPSTSSSRRSGKWRQKLTGCPSAGLIPECQHKTGQKEQGNKASNLGGTKGRILRTVKDFVLLCIFIFGCRWWQGNILVVLTHLKWFICFWRLKWKRIGLFLFCRGGYSWTGVTALRKSANAWLFSRRWDCLRLPIKWSGGVDHSLVYF